MAPLPEETGAAPAAATPAAPVAAKIDTPKEVKRPSGWKIFATVLHSNRHF